MPKQQAPFNSIFTEESEQDMQLVQQIPTMYMDPISNIFYSLKQQEQY